MFTRFERAQEKYTALQNCNGYTIRIVLIPRNFLSTCSGLILTIGLKPPWCHIYVNIRVLFSREGVSKLSRRLVWWKIRFDHFLRSQKTKKKRTIPHWEADTLFPSIIKNNIGDHLTKGWVGGWKKVIFP